MTKNDLINLSIRSASVNTLESAMKTAAKIINRSVNRLESHSDTKISPALDILKKESRYNKTGLFEPSALKFDFKGKSAHEYRVALMHEVARAQKFLRSKTSTVTGTRQHIKQSIEILGSRFTLNNIDKESLNQLVSKSWEDFHKFIEENQNIGYWTKSQRRQVLSDYIKAKEAGKDPQKYLQDKEQQRTDEIEKIKNLNNFIEGWTDVTDLFK